LPLHPVMSDYIEREARMHLLGRQGAGRVGNSTGVNAGARTGAGVR